MSPRAPREQSLRVRLNDDELRRLDAAAGEAGKNRAEWAREILLRASARAIRRPGSGGTDGSNHAGEADPEGGAVTAVGTPSAAGIS